MSPTALTSSKLGLPAELVWLIFSIVAFNHRPTALILAQISHGFSTAMLQLVYEVVSLHPRPGEGHQTRADLFRTTINTYPERAHWVKVILHRPSDESTNVDIISKCSRVRTLHLSDGALFRNFIPNYHDAEKLEINLSNQLLMAGSLTAPMFQKVTHLMFQDNIPISPLVAEIVLLPRLTHLSMAFSQCVPGDDFPQQFFSANVQTLLANHTLKMIHLYFRADFLKIFVDPVFLNVIHDLISLNDPRLFVGLGRHWGGWAAWCEFYREGRDFWKEIETGCRTWRNDFHVPEWVLQQSAEPPHI